ncbi:MAG: hypothetical protein OXH22_13180 [Chloroflexi bacterium]|nr:hypothetical protein [Chloroflexota bacterium]
MSQALLKLSFYLVTGVILSAITWGTLSHSAVTGDYALSVVLLGMMFYVAGKFFVDRWQPGHAPQDFHPTKLWKMPQATTGAGLWLRVGYSTAAHIAVYALLASILVLTTTARFPFMILLGSLFILRIPHLYWTMRGYYEAASSDGDDRQLRYKGGSSIHRRTRWLVPAAMAGVGGSLAAVALIVS